MKDTELLRLLDEKALGFDIFSSQSNINLFAEALLNLEEAANALEVYTKVFKPRTPGLTPEIFMLLRTIDPTPGLSNNITASAEENLRASTKGAYIDWIVRQYNSTLKREGENAAARFVDEDAESLKLALDRFDKAKKNSESGKKLTDAAKEKGIITGDEENKSPLDINTYSRITLLDVTSIFEKERKLGLKNEDKVEVLYEDSIWQVVIPETHAAARKYGTDTNWCTATSSDSWYNSYTQKGPLIILKNKRIEAERAQSSVRGRPARLNYKWQYHSGSNQFKNQQDRGVGLYSFIKQFMSTKDPADPVFASTKKAIDAIINNPHNSPTAAKGEAEKWNYQQVLDAVGNAYDLVTKAIAKVQDPALAVIKTYETEYGETVGVLNFAIGEGNVDLVNDLLDLPEAMWTTGDLVPAMIAALKYKDSSVFGNILRRAPDKIQALASPGAAPRGVSILGAAILKGTEWYSEAMQALITAETRTVDENGNVDVQNMVDTGPHGIRLQQRALLSITPPWGNAFTQAILQSRLATEENLISVAKVIAQLFPVRLGQLQIAEALVHTPAPTNNYFEMPVQIHTRYNTAIELAEEQGMHQLVKTLKALSGVTGVDKTPLKSGQALSMFILSGAYKDNPTRPIYSAIMSLRRYEARRPQVIPMPSLLGFVLIIDLIYAKSKAKNVREYLAAVRSPEGEKLIAKNNKEMMAEYPNYVASIFSHIIDLDSNYNGGVHNSIQVDPSVVDYITSEFIKLMNLTAKKLISSVLDANSLSYRTGRTLLVNLFPVGPTPGTGNYVRGFCKHLNLDPGEIIKSIVKKAIKNHWSTADSYTEYLIMILTGVRLDGVRYDWAKIHDIVIGEIKTEEDMTELLNAIKKRVSDLKGRPQDLADANVAADSIVVKIKKWIKDQARALPKANAQLALPGPKPKRKGLFGRPATELPAPDVNVNEDGVGFEIMDGG